MGIGDFVQGAIGGGLAGGGFTPLGGLGALVGGLAGYFGGGSDADANRKAQMDYFNQLGSIGPASQGAYSEFRGNQRNYINNLENMAAGRGPSLADAQMRAATDRSTKQSMGLAQSGAGNPAANMMMAQEAAGQMGSQNAQNAMQGRIQEQLNAMNLLGINLHGARGADEDMNRFNASQQNNYTLDTNRLRGMVLNGAGNGASGTSLGEQIMAGGAGMFGAQMLGRGNQQKAPVTGPPGTPGTGYQTWQNPNAGPRY